MGRPCKVICKSVAKAYEEFWLVTYAPLVWSGTCTPKETPQ